MPTVHCIECDEQIEVEGRTRLGQRITCDNCGAELEIVSLTPLDIDYADEDGEDLDDDWEEDEYDSFDEDDEDDDEFDELDEDEYDEDVDALDEEDDFDDEDDDRRQWV
jgi:lysine biosynthesis protein LysW